MRGVGCIFKQKKSSDDQGFFPRALLIARKLKAKQGKVEESSIDKVAEKVNSGFSPLFYFLLGSGASQEG